MITDAEILHRSFRQLCPCKICNGSGVQKEIEEYIDGYPRYEDYWCRWCKGKGYSRKRLLEEMKKI